MEFQIRVLMGEERGEVGVEVVDSFLDYDTWRFGW